MARELEQGEGAKEDAGKQNKKSKAHKRDSATKATVAASNSTLLASHRALDPSLASLFAVKQPPVKAKIRAVFPPANQHHSAENDAELSSLADEDIDEEIIYGEGESLDDGLKSDGVVGLEDDQQLQADSTPAGGDGEGRSRRKRKRSARNEALEGDYLNRLAREDAKETRKLALDRAAKRPKADRSFEGVENDEERDEEEDSVAIIVEQDVVDERNGNDLSPPPKHETELEADQEFEKANRTVFLGNVSTTAITSKAARKTLLVHLTSFFDSLPAQRSTDVHRKLESIRFRSTPYASAIPKKAAFAKQEIMDATTKSTNAYAIYSSASLARQAANHLNGTIVLKRHLRVDEVAHPAPIDHRRCVFIGNLGFVDDESNILDANEADGREKRKRGKEPADIEEGLWQTFGKCGKVESVRVIRDSTTRVGKGIAYVQFQDENDVEAALLLNEKKFPPMLPRKLRVSRAKAQKRNAKPGSGRPTSRPDINGNAAASGKYRRKVSAEEASKMGRAGKLLGRAAASQMRRPHSKAKVHSNGIRSTSPSQRLVLGDGVRKLESFVFEGHRATAKQGKSGLKLGGKGGGKKKARVTKRSSSFKAKKKQA